jgi:crotonobetainyl-CoA:carnitine CoA-transferase CaiB-like acyl-CoA transferase
VSGLLAGVRVLDLSGLLPGPFATLMLADLGAEVIKVESRLGDLARQVPPRAAGQGAWFQAYNRNKRSLGLDLRKPAGRALFMDLVRHADVVVESFRPGRAERMGVGADACRAANPRLVYCSLSGFGQAGPDAGRSGHDITYLARTGALTLFRDSAGRPVIPPLQIADLSAGVTAALGIVAALFDRARTGEGCALDISLLDSVLPWMAGYLAAAHAGVHLGEEGATPLSGRYPFYQVYETADGGWVAVGALEPLFWSDLCAALGRPDLAPLQFGVAGERAAVTEALTAAFAARPAAEWAVLFRERNLAAEVVADLADVAADPRLAARGLLAVVPYAEGEVLQVGSPIHAAGHPAPAPSPAPRLGADTRAVLAEVLGLADDAIDGLVAERTVFDAADAAPRQIAPDEIP